MLDAITSLSPSIAGLITSLIGAAATVLVALIQMRIAWRKELQARAEHRPISKKARRGPIWAVLVLLLASAVGGFSLSQYLMSERRNKAEVLESELNNRIDQLALSAQRLEHISSLGKDDLMQEFRLEEARRLGRAGVVAVTGVDKCLGTESAKCNEQQALHVQLCTEIPVAATVSSIDLFVRKDDRPWQSGSVTAGNDFGDGRFEVKPIEQAMTDELKQVCHDLRYWGGDYLQARMVVRYVPGEKDSASDLATSLQ